MSGTSPAPAPSPRILLKPAEVGDLLSISKRAVYDLIATNADLRAAVVRIPGVRGTFVRRDLLEAVIERWSPGVLHESKTGSAATEREPRGGA